ncbi:MAG TPA: YjbE family putative metal transport protein [Ktedonobacterales bacterium]
MGAFLASLGAIILVDLTLSGDNALVIGAAASGLPRRQRLLAILVGGGGAIVLRILFTAAAALLLTLPLLQVIGGAVLLIIAVRLLLEREHARLATTSAQTRDDGGTRSDLSFRQALLTILVADVTMSLDNILAIGGLARGDLPLLAIGLVISIALLMAGSALVAELIGRLPALLDLAALALGWTAGTMALHDYYAGPYVHLLPYAEYVAPAIGAVIVLAIDLALRAWTARRARRQVASQNAAPASDPTPSR